MEDGKSSAMVGMPYKEQVLGMRYKVQSMRYKEQFQAEATVVPCSVCVRYKEQFQAGNFNHRRLNFPRLLFSRLVRGSSCHNVELISTLNHVESFQANTPTMYTAPDHTKF